MHSHPLDRPISGTIKTPLVRAVLYLMTSALLFSSMGVLIRIVSRHVDNSTVVFSRNLAGVLLLGPVLWLHSGKKIWVTQRLWLHLLRATSGLTAMYGFFYALAHIPLANAMVFTYSAPIFIPVLAWLFLGERITAKIIYTTVLGLIGVIFVCKPHTSLWNLMTLVGLGSAFLAAIAFICVRALASTETPGKIVLYFASISTLLSALPFLKSTGLHPLTLHFSEFLLLPGIGILATLSQLCLSKAYSLAPASRIGPINYLAIVLAGFYAWLLWGEVPDASAWTGFVLIIYASWLCLNAEPPKALD